MQITTFYYDYCLRAAHLYFIFILKINTNVFQITKCEVLSTDQYFFFNVIFKYYILFFYNFSTVTSDLNKIHIFLLIN